MSVKTGGRKGEEAGEKKRSGARLLLQVWGEMQREKQPYDELTKKEFDSRAN